MVEYVKVEFDSLGAAYQEIDAGSVQRYRSLDGVELFVTPPIGQGCRVVDARPLLPEWAGVSPEIPAETRSQALSEAPSAELVAEITKRTLSQKEINDLDDVVKAAKG